MIGMSTIRSTRYFGLPDPEREGINFFYTFKLQKTG
jgi:hypothetical protein